MLLPKPVYPCAYLLSTQHVHTALSTIARRLSPMLDHLSRWRPPIYDITFNPARQFGARKGCVGEIYAIPKNLLPTRLTHCADCGYCGSGKKVGARVYGNCEAILGEQAFEQHAAKEPAELNQKEGVKVPESLASQIDRTNCPRCDLDWRCGLNGHCTYGARNANRRHGGRKLASTFSQALVGLAIDNVIADLIMTGYQRGQRSFILLHFLIIAGF